jgi:hypothetical protein
LSTASPLRLELSPCPALAAVILGLHLAAAACLLLAYPRLEGVVLAILLVALGAVAACNRALLLGRRAPRAIEISPSAEALLVRADGLQARARPVRGIGVTRWWVVLRLGSPGRGGFLISAGMLPSEPFRRLRLWALWERAPGVVPGQLPG